MSGESNADVLRAFQEAVGSGAWDKAASLLADDVVFHEAPSLPYGGDYHGVAGYRELVERAVALGRFEYGSTPHSHTTNEGVVILESEFTVTGTKTGRSATTPFAEVYRFVDAKIADVFVFYFDGPAVTAALVD
jgi:hypothetical protein